MEAQIKEELHENSLCFESPEEDFGSLSLVQKYNRYLEHPNSAIDSDGDSVPDESVLKEEIAQVRNDTSNCRRKNHRLSTGLPAKYRNNTTTNISVTDDDTTNGNSEGLNPFESVESLKDIKSGLVGLNELIEKLGTVRRCEPEGNSIFCTKDELEIIQERYGEILDFIHQRSSSFERTNSPRDLTSRQADEEQDQDEEHEEIKVTEDEETTEEQSYDLKLLAEKMETVEQARDKFYEVQQIVRDQLDQLELVERDKMKSVG